MPRERSFWLLLTAVIAIGVLGGLLGRRERVETLALLPAAPRPASQVARERVFRTSTYEKLYELPAGQGAPLGLPTLLRTDSAGSLYVLDSGRPRVVKVSSRGRSMATYAHPTLGDPTDVAVARDGQVWVCDPDRRSVAVFTSSGVLTRRIPLHPAAARLILDGRGGFVATTLAGGSGLFHRHSGSDWTGAFGSLFRPELQNTFAVDGWLVPAGTGFVYLFRYAGLILSYDANDSVRFFRRTLAPVPLPRVREDAAGTQSVSRDSPVASLAGGVVRDALVVLSPSASGGPRVLDVYDAATGDYRYSLRPPEADLRCIAVAGDRIFGAGPSGVTAWRWSP